MSPFPKGEKCKKCNCIAFGGFLKSTGMNSGLNSRSESLVILVWSSLLNISSVSLHSSGCKIFPACPFIFVRFFLFCFPYSDFQLNCVAVLSYLAYFVTLKLPVACFHYCCFINAACTASRKRCWEQRPPYICRRQ